MLVILVLILVIFFLFVIVCAHKEMIALEKAGQETDKKIQTLRPIIEDTIMPKGFSQYTLEDVMSSINNNNINTEFSLKI